MMPPKNTQGRGQSVHAPRDLTATSATTGAMRTQLVGVFDHESHTALVVLASEVKHE
jgi:hypothetical protein